MGGGGQQRQAVVVTQQQASGDRQGRAVVGSGGQQRQAGAGIGEQVARWTMAAREIPQEGPSENRASSGIQVTRRARPGQYARLWWESQGSGENRRGVLDAGRVR